LFLSTPTSPCLHVFFSSFFQLSRPDVLDDYPVAKRLTRKRIAANVEKGMPKTAAAAAAAAKAVRAVNSARDVARGAITKYNNNADNGGSGGGVDAAGRSVSLTQRIHYGRGGDPSTVARLRVLKRRCGGLNALVHPNFSRKKQQKTSSKSAAASVSRTATCGDRLRELRALADSGDVVGLHFLVFTSPSSRFHDAFSRLRARVCVCVCVFSYLHVCRCSCKVSFMCRLLCATILTINLI
jgi:hypothetical protein